MQAFQSLLELLGMLVMDPRTGVLIALLIVASVCDFRIYRIPNWLTAGGMVLGLLYNAAVPISPHVGFLWALEGLLLGLLMTLPLYVLKAMGAGDIKLIAMAGAFLGAPAIFYAVISTFIVGGVAALGYALFNRALGRMLGNVKNIVQIVLLSAIDGIKPDVHMETSKSVGRLPYGVSICIGVTGYMVARQLGYL